MDIVFFGSSKFAVPSLKALLDAGQNIVHCVTQPDKKKGRGLQSSGTPVKAAALELKLPVYQPQDLNSRESEEFLKKLKPDLFVVIAYGQLLKEEILSIPKVFSMNIHGSLLPKYRGAAPVNWAIIKGEETTGVTAIKLTKDMDAGPILAQEAVEIDKDCNSLELEDTLSRLGADLLIECLKNIEADTYEIIMQDENKVSFAPKLRKKDGLIAWDRLAPQIHDLIRGCFGWPGAYTVYNGKLLKVHKSSLAGAHVTLSPGNEPGTIVDISDGYIGVAAKDSILFIRELQVEGKKRMTAQEFISGYKIAVGETLG